ncbi:MerR family transcriptional regulator [Nonomuraea sp. 3N208]|uniref:MerR family transcriptional regulator n=1 Tax=Nonomuraea sp. 3N208 TaxID=3457421 RepID=UPI003FD0E225
MLVGELARRTNVTVRALRYYEKAGLVVPQRLPNGYRHYDPVAVRQVEEIKELTSLGLSVEETRPFVECLASGHASGDECPASLAAYRHAVDQMSQRIERLIRRRDALAAHLEAAAGRAIPTPQTAPVSTTTLMHPQDDGAAAHLVGRPLPAIALLATDGTTAGLAALGPGRTVLYLYPLTGRPGVDLPDGWDTIPGARGCTPEACGFRDHHEELREAGAARVFGLSSQSSAYQREVVERLRLPFRMLSDPDFAVRDALELPTFEAGGLSLYRRLTMIVHDGVIEHVFYPVFPPDQHAGQVLAWLRAHPEIGR